MQGKMPVPADPPPPGVTERPTPENQRLPSHVSPNETPGKGTTDRPAPPPHKKG